MVNLQTNSLKFKIIAGFAFIFIAVVIFGVLVATSLGQVIEDYRDAQTFMKKQTHPIAHLRADLLKATMPVNDFLTTMNYDEIDQFDKDKTAIDREFTLLKKNVTNQRTRGFIVDAEKLWIKARVQGVSILSARFSSVDNSSGTRMDRFDGLIESSIAKLDRAEARLAEKVEKRLQSARRFRGLSNIFIIFISILTPTISVIAALWLIKIVLSPIASLQKGAQFIANGDLEHDFAFQASDEFEVLAEEFNIMARRLKENRDSLHELAIQDGLTELFNHREFHRLLRQEIERSKRSKKPVSLLFLDIDNFKKYNDTFGHKQGDSALKIVANILQEQVRQIDVAARYGGEEFAIVLLGTIAEKASFIAERIREAISAQPFIVKEEVNQLSV
ncbi:MAG: diguanylate cyclase, partial [Actinomycetia bacterium]|nr:diguanylate cyclase [Actinomycetes bacterium]